MAENDQSLMAGYVAGTIESWRKSVDKVLAGADFEKKLVTPTLEGIAVQPLYTEADWSNRQDRAGFAGAPPYRRGSLAIGRSGAHWDLRVKVEHPDPAQARAEIASAQKRGLRSLWLKLDRQARTGRAAAQSDHDLGAACLSAQQLGELLAGVALDRTPVSIDAGGNALAVAACLVAAARARDVNPAQLDGLLNADPLGALASDGALASSLASAGEQLAALGVWATERAPKLRAATVSLAPYHDAGAHAGQELAIGLATGLAYLRWLTAAGLSASEAARQIAFSVPVGSDLFMEIAKLRALRQCWSQVVAACGGGAEDQKAVVHAFTSSRTKSQRDPWVNMLRETTEAFAAAVGGADAITTAGFDRAIGPSDDFARRIGENVQVVLDEEAHVTQVADPAGGSYYVEQLTDALAERAWQLFQKIEAEGGVADALTSGRIASLLDATAKARAANIAKRKQAITGVSEFAHVTEEPVVRALPDWQAISAARAAALEAASADDSIAKPLSAARAAGITSRANALACVDKAIDVAAQGASLDQLAGALAGQDSTARITALPVRRDAAPIEALRDRANEIEKKSGKRPAVFLANLGPIPQHKARSQFASGFVAAGGFAAVDNDGFDTAEKAAAAFAASKAPVAVLCGSDEAYTTWVAELAPLLKQAGAKRIVLAGRPAASELEAQYKQAGVTDFIFMGADVVKMMGELLAQVEVV
jgi:methylmalonyl-CoA mutase